MSILILWFAAFVCEAAESQTQSHTDQDRGPAKVASAAQPAPEAEDAAPAPSVIEPVKKTYAMRQTFTSQMRNPNPFAKGEWKSTRTHTWALVRWTQVNDKVQYAEDTCSVQTNPVFGASTHYPDAFIKGIPDRQRTATLLADTGRFMAGPYAQQFGVKLENPFKDALPTEASDSRIEDTDHDGHPGMTVNISHPMMGEGSVYVAQRSVARLEGELQADGSIRGVVFTGPDMFRIDASRWWLNGEAPQRQHPDPRQSPFVLVPVTSNSTCASILSQKDTLFPTMKELGIVSP